MYIKKTVTTIFKSLLLIIALILIYLLCASFLPKITIDKENNTKEEVEIHILTNGVHTDIVVPSVNEQMDWRKEILYSNTLANDTTQKYLAMGWGDKGFYLETPTWADLKASVAIKAATGLSTTAIHATYYSKMIESETCKKILISKDQYQRLIDYISNSFQRDSLNHFVNIKTKANYGKNDAFYNANGRYSLFHTCNSWANNGLKSCGQKCCLWTPLDKGIFEKYKN